MVAGVSKRLSNRCKTRSYLKNADYVQRQEAHLNQYNQMCYPAYAGARADEKAESRQRRDEQYILRRSATPYLGVRCIFEIVSS
jgi:hypothetical protein